MAKVKPRLKNKGVKHHIRAWRKHRGLTLERLAERIGVTHGAIAQLERGEVNYTQPMLEALADALSCTPADLVGRPPDKDFGPSVRYERLLAILEGASPEEQRRIEDIAQVITRKAG